MIMAIHEPEHRDPKYWRRWFLRLSVVSILLAILNWWATGQIGMTLYAAAIPWGLLLACLFISLIWTLLLGPLLALVGRFAGVKK